MIDCITIPTTFGENNKRRKCFSKTPGYDASFENRNAVIQEPGSSSVLNEVMGSIEIVKDDSFDKEVESEASQQESELQSSHDETFKVDPSFKELDAFNRKPKSEDEVDREDCLSDYNPKSPCFAEDLENSSSNAKLKTYKLEIGLFVQGVEEEPKTPYRLDLELLILPEHSTDQQVELKTFSLKRELFSENVPKTTSSIVELKTFSLKPGPFRQPSPYWSNRDPESPLSLNLFSFQEE